MTRAFVDRPVGDRRLAEAAAITAAEHWGLDRPVPLRTGMNVIFETGSVILRVSRPSVPGLAMLELHEALRSFGVPVSRPARSDVVTLGDVVVTCWERVVETGEKVDWGIVGGIVRRVHSVRPDDLPAGFPLVAPRDLPWWDFESLLTDTAELIDERARAGIDAALDRWTDWQEWDEGAVDDRGGIVVCHGDVHPGNVLMTVDGPVLIDWDLTGLAPAAWDHAPLLTWAARWGGEPGIYEAFAEGYGHDFRGDPVAEGYAELRLVAATLMRIRAGRDDPTARLEAERRLSFWRGDVDAPAWTAQ